MDLMKQLGQAPALARVKGALVGPAELRAEDEVLKDHAGRALERKRSIVPDALIASVSLSTRKEY